MFFVILIIKYFFFRKHKDDLTDIYYALQLLPSVRHYHLGNAWQKFIKRPFKQQLLEEAMNIAMLWYSFENRISHSYMNELTNYVVELLMTHLKTKYSEHPIFSISNEQFSYWECNNIDDTEWNYIKSREILDTLCEVLSELYFHEIKCCKSNNL